MSAGKARAEDEARADQRAQGMSPTQQATVGTPKSQAPALEAALQIVCEHARNVGVATLGRLSSASKRMGAVVELAPIWRELFEEAVHASLQQWTRPGNSTLLTSAGLTQISWGGEKGILPAFADIELAEQVGFRKAFKCLASYTCEVCQVSVPGNPKPDSTNATPSTLNPQP